MNDDSAPDRGTSPQVPDVTLVVPTLGRSPWLAPCLRALRREADALSGRPGGAELVVVVPAGLGAGSGNPRGALAPAFELADRLVEVERPGFAAANNRAYAESGGRYWATINDDAVVGEGWASRLCAVLDAEPGVAAVQGANLVLSGDLPSGSGGSGAEGPIDGLGIGWNRSWQAVQLGHGQPSTSAGIGAAGREIFGVSATAALYRRAALDALTDSLDRGASLPFDERLWAYYEDVDLAWRLRGAGWTARLEPGARAWHGGSTTGRTLAFGGRQLIHGNRHLVLARHLGRKFWAHWPRLLWRDARDAARLLVGRDGAGALGVLAGVARALLRLPAFGHLGAAGSAVDDLVRFRSTPKRRST